MENNTTHFSGRISKNQKEQLLKVARQKGFSGLSSYLKALAFYDKKHNILPNK